MLVWSRGFFFFFRLMLFEIVVDLLISLVSILELPWDQPTLECAEYMAWKDGKALLLTPWSKLDHLALSLVRKMLVPLPSGRSKIREIIAHRWSKKHFDKLGKYCVEFSLFS